MKRNWLHWFYVIAQFALMAISIPRVALLFHNYSTEDIGPLLGGIDLQSWLGGGIIDLVVAVTTTGALRKFGVTGKRSSLIPAFIVIFPCVAFSMVANFEDAALKNPQLYAHITVVTVPALVLNPLILSGLPLIVLIFVAVAPMIATKPALKSAEEIMAEANEAEAKILAQGRIREAKARVNASVRGTQLRGFVGNVSALRNQPEEPVSVPRLPEVRSEPRLEQDFGSSGIIPLPTKMTRTLWNAMPLKERVNQSGLITPQEIADILGISLSHARNLVKGFEKQTVQGRSGYPYQELIDSIYARRTKDSFDWARKLETTLKPKRRSLQVVPGSSQDSTEESDTEIEEGEA
jgi:hypothetical protein